MQVEVNIILPPSADCVKCQAEYEGELESLNGDLESVQDALDTTIEGLREALADKKKEIAALKAEPVRGDILEKISERDYWHGVANKRAARCKELEKEVEAFRKSANLAINRRTRAVARYDRLREAVEPIMLACQSARQSKQPDEVRLVTRANYAWAAIAAACDGEEEAEGGEG